MSKPKNPETIAAANGIAADRPLAPSRRPSYCPALSVSRVSTQPRAHDYSRAANPTREMLADTIAKLEGGAGAVVVSSGMAAVDLTLSQLGRDDLVVAPHDCYGGTYRLLAARRDRGQFNVAFIDQNDAGALDAALRRRPSLVLIETPSNPLMRVSISALSRRGRMRRARKSPSTTLSCRPRCNSPSRSAPTS